MRLKLSGPLRSESRVITIARSNLHDLLCLHRSTPNSTSVRGCSRLQGNMSMFTVSYISSIGPVLRGITKVNVAEHSLFSVQGADKYILIFRITIKLCCERAIRAHPARVHYQSRVTWFIYEPTPILNGPVHDYQKLKW